MVPLHNVDQHPSPSDARQFALKAAAPIDQFRRFDLGLISPRTSRKSLRDRRSAGGRCLELETFQEYTLRMIRVRVRPKELALTDMG